MFSRSKVLQTQSLQLADPSAVLVKDSKALVKHSHALRTALAAFRKARQITVKQHHYKAAAGAGYLIILTPRVAGLISALQANRDPVHLHDIYRQFDSELLE